MSPAFTIGLDYGTNSVRAVVVDCADGSALGTHVFNYPSGDHGVIVDAREPHLARQNPADYLEGLRQATRGALAAAAAVPSFATERVIGIGVDTTGSTPIPVDALGRALALDPQWADNRAAHAWLWKDHTGYAEAAEITARASIIGLCWSTLTVRLQDEALKRRSCRNGPAFTTFYSLRRMESRAVGGMITRIRITHELSSIPNFDI